QLRDRLAFHIERATAPDVPALHRATERIDLPVLGRGQDYVHVIEEDQRARTAVAPQAGAQIGLAGSGFEDLGLDAVAPQHRAEPARGRDLVARRVGRVD